MDCFWSWMFLAWYRIISLVIITDEKKIEMVVINPALVLGPVLHGSTCTSMEVCFIVYACQKFFLLSRQYLLVYWHSLKLFEYQLINLSLGKWVLYLYLVSHHCFVERMGLFKRLICLLGLFFRFQGDYYRKKCPFLQECTFRFAMFVM